MLSHVDSNNQPAMVDVGDKAVTKRTAHARTTVVVGAEIMALLEDGDIRSKKGPVFQTAIIAGTMACKKTSDLIPFCHPLAIEDCTIAIAPNAEGEVIIDCRVSLHAKTGVEMEALTGATVAALTIYDMCKAMSHDIVIADTRLISKVGGKTEHRDAPSNDS